MITPYGASIDNPKDINKFIQGLIDLLMGGSITPLIGNTSITSLPAGTCIYGIKADGAANLVLSAITNTAGTNIVSGGDVTILAGDILYGAYGGFTLVSGKYTVYLRNI